ncbi:hypothetical protein FLL57_10165 [Rhodopseudomonas palustris]|uniref:hypothetical protein n=1 Tax=Rhodopseudomonas palustris TaxID=1076 RepID=UPI00115C568F|nr:hypothetical protein [Rhodopseudomonas palustris]QDL97650.1 hypothetical protein FLL57_10165 [Rhodopseudomonas palustris]
MNILDFIFQFVAPAAIGGAASILAPWANWGIERQRQRLARRQRLIDDWRRELIDNWNPGFDVVSESGRGFTTTSSYLSLRPYLQPDIRKKFDPRPGVIAIEIGGDPGKAKRLIADEINRIERAWKLV